MVQKYLDIARDNSYSKNCYELRLLDMYVSKSRKNQTPLAPFPQ